MNFFLENIYHFLNIFIICSIVMIALWFLAFKIENLALVDLGWSFNFLFIILYLTFHIPIFSFLNIVFFIMVASWSLRLGLYLFFARIYKKEEEGRYKKLREKWKSNLKFNFLLFYLMQAFTNVILSIPFFLVYYLEDKILFNHIIGIGIFLIAFMGEAIADLQLYYFKKEPKNHNKVFKEGLWKYSRHPNYFFEILIWFSYGIFFLNTSYWYLGFFSFIVISFFILKITGIPATEEQNLSTKKEEYYQYIQTTSPLIPLPAEIYKKLRGDKNDRFFIKA